MLTNNNEGEHALPTNKELARPLNAVSPRLYRYITSELEKNFNIHTYDLQIDGIKESDEIHVIIKYGKYFTEKLGKIIPIEEIENPSAVLNEFIKEAGEACTKVLIDDYFKKMTP